MTSSYLQLLAISWNENFIMYTHYYCRFRWPRGLRRGPKAARFLGLRVRIPAGEWMSVCYECCILSGRGLSLRRADQLSRGVLPSVVCLSVIVKPQ